MVQVMLRAWSYALVQRRSFCGRSGARSRLPSYVLGSLWREASELGEDSLSLSPPSLSQRAQVTIGEVQGQGVRIASRCQSSAWRRILTLTLTHTLAPPLPFPASASPRCAGHPNYVALCKDHHHPPWCNWATGAGPTGLCRERLHVRLTAPRCAKRGGMPRGDIPRMPRMPRGDIPHQAERGICPVPGLAGYISAQRIQRGVVSSRRSTLRPPSSAAAGWAAIQCGSRTSPPPCLAASLCRPTLVPCQFPSLVPFRAS